MLTEGTSENQIQHFHFPFLYLSKMAQEPGMKKECDREDDIFLYSEHPSVQKCEDMWTKQDKLEWKNKLKLITRELKQKFGEICEKQKQKQKQHYCLS